MTDSKRPRLDSVHRYVQSELTSSESRELAQKSLDDPELFEDLTYSALTKAALANPSVREQLKQTASPQVFRFSRRSRIWMASAAAALALVSFYFSRSPLRQETPQLTQHIPSETVKPSPVLPTLGFSTKDGRPVLLAQGLQPQPSRPDSAPVFRGAEPASRTPRPTGSIVAIKDGLATIDLGSLDGVAKGNELRVFRDERSAQVVGRLKVTAVFRERSRGQMDGEREIRVNDRVRVTDEAHLSALLQQVDALSDRGDADGARAMAGKAVAWAEAANVPPSGRRRALSQLAAREYQAGTVETAEKHYQAAADTLKDASVSSSDDSEVLNNLAVLRLLRGDRDGAEGPLKLVTSQSSPMSGVHGRSLNNLGVLAELRGDRQKAEEFYKAALAALIRLADSSEQERRVVEANLARLGRER